jgi:hypothetical protein
MSRYAEALANARACLALFGVSFPDTDEDKQAALERELETIQSLLGQRSIGALIELPVMTHPETRMVMTILTDSWSSAYILGDGALAVLAENCPENFLCQSLLLSAEIERLRGCPLAAMDKYEQALLYASETNSLQYQALASEVYARFCLQRGQERIAAAFLTDARSWDALWGAAAKVTALEHKYKELLGRPARPNLSLPTVSLSAPALSETAVGDLDFSTVMKAAQAITGEIELEKLLATLMRIAIENAGAERGSLLLEHEGESYIHAEGSLDTAEVSMHHAIPLSEAHSLPTSMVHYVRRTL